MKKLIIILIPVLLLAAALRHQYFPETISQIYDNGKGFHADAEAKFNIGNRCAGEKDYVEAVKWFRMAANQNNANAQASLGGCYAEGKGVAKDEVEAAKWYRMAAEQNNADGEQLLAFCYYFGEGVAKDDVEAYKWFLLAAAQGEMHPSSRTGMTKLEESMSPEQIAEGQKRAQALLGSGGNTQGAPAGPLVTLDSGRTVQLWKPR